MTNALADAARLRDRLKSWATEAAYPLWWKTGADPAGGFFEKLSLEGKPVEGPRRGRVLPRQIYSYSVAGELGWTGPWREGRRAWPFLLPVGLSPSRRPVPDPGRGRRRQPGRHRHLYDQAFSMFAAANVARVAPERAEAMRQLHRGARDADRHAQASARRLLPDRSTQPAAGLQRAHAFARGLPGLVGDRHRSGLARLGRRDRRTDPVALHPAESGMLREFFDLDWNPAPGREGRICEPGHQFEWGWLLLRWGKLTGRADATAAALRMIEAGETHGIDVENGVAINALLDDFSVDDANARLWPQTERIKAAALAAEVTGEPQWWAWRRPGAEGLMAYLRTPVPGPLARQAAAERRLHRGAGSGQLVLPHRLRDRGAG
jgi:mannose/cellobiose epimerase-like protein (N-acyl-D-glucosamine 2-epimerase family)